MGGHAREVDDVWSDRYLPAEMRALHRPMTQTTPQPILGIGLIEPKPSCGLASKAIDRTLGHVADSPDAGTVALSHRISPLSQGGLRPAARARRGVSPHPGAPSGAPTLPFQGRVAPSVWHHLASVRQAQVDPIVVEAEIERGQPQRRIARVGAGLEAVLVAVPGTDD